MYCTVRTPHEEIVREHTVRDSIQSHMMEWSEKFRFFFVTTTPNSKLQQKDKEDLFFGLEID